MLKRPASESEKSRSVPFVKKMIPYGVEDNLENITLIAS